MSMLTATKRALAIAGLSATALAILAAPSLAHFGYTPIGKFGSPGAGAGQFTSPLGVAIEESSGDVYVVDSGNNRVEKFEPSGKFLSEFNGSETLQKAFAQPRQVAVDNSTDASKGNVYVSDPSQNVVDVFSSSGIYLFQIKISELVAITIDAEGHLWAWTNQTSFEEYSETGTKLLRHEVGRGKDPGIVVDSKGNVYVIYGDSCVGRYSPPKYEENNEAGNCGANTLAINPATNNIFQDNGGNIVEWPPFGEGPKLWERVEESFGSLNSSEGLAINGTGRELYASERGANDVQEYETILTPDATTEAASKITRTSATIEGIVNPDKTKAKYFFQWGEGGSLAKSTPVEEAGEGESNETEAITLTGLNVSTRYSYRIVTENENGQNFGATKSFTTFGAVENIATLAPSGLTSSGETFNGELTPNGYLTKCWFEYEGGQLSNTKTAEQNVGEAFAVVKPAQAITGLEPNVSYRNRLACSNTFGTSYGSYTSGRTLPAPPTVIGQSTSNIARTRAVLLASINPENDETYYYFEYGPTAAYGYKTAEQELSSALYGEQAAQGVATELKSNTLYHFRVVAKNSAGIVRGPDATFTSGSPTPPVVMTGGVSNLGPIGVTLEGLVTTEGLVTSYGFEITSNPECKTNPAVFGPPTGLGSVGAGFAEAPATLAVTGLKPDTTYCYKLVGANADGTSEGEVHEFTTLTYPPDQISVEQLRVLTEPLSSWPVISSPLYLKEEAKKAPAPVKCKKGQVKKNGKCVKKSKKAKGKSNKKG